MAVAKVNLIPAWVSGHCEWFYQFAAFFAVAGLTCCDTIGPAGVSTQ